MKVATARESFINLCERILKKLKINARDPYKPGPNYYDGCFKKGKKQELKEDKDEEVILVASQEDMMEEAGVPVASIIFLVVLYLCCFCCIGCCVRICQRRKQKDKENELQIQVAQIDEFDDNNKQTVVM